jgi:hypothetical protein
LLSWYCRGSERVDPEIGHDEPSSGQCQRRRRAEAGREPVRACQDRSSAHTDPSLAHLVGADDGNFGLAVGSAAELETNKARADDDELGLLVALGELGKGGVDLLGVLDSAKDKDVLEIGAIDGRALWRLVSQLPLQFHRMDALWERSQWRE